MKISFSRIKQWLSEVVSSRIYYYLLALNLISNCAAAYIYEATEARLMMISLSFSSAYFESLIIYSFRDKAIRRTFMSIAVLLHNLMITADYFVISNFQKIVNQDIIDILAETNLIEIKNFINSYINFGVLFCGIAGIIILNIMLWLISKRLSKTKIYPINAIIATVGFAIWGYMCHNFIRYKSGMSIPQYHTITRTAYAYYIMKQRMGTNKLLCDVARSTKAVSSVSSASPPNIVVIIGESFSVYHSSLYGYENDTNPKLREREKKGELIVYRDVVSAHENTHGAMRSIFSLSSLGNNFDNLPLFPMCFKSAGYYNVMHDNQYKVGEGVNFLSDKELSDLMFNYRNNKRFQYDEDLIKEIDLQNAIIPYLYIIHLYGQHYTYTERYPTAFRKFKKEEEDKTKTEKQRKIIANYDNAMLYNDYIVNNIFNIFENEDCCIIYLSDHGEEIYDFRNYMGHGNAIGNHNIKYQIRVPLMIYMTRKFREKRAELAENIKKSANYPVITDDVSHLILDIAGIKTKYFDATRSVINRSYNKSKHRIVLGSIDYDDIK